ncbi:subtilisin-like protein [Suillus decipiens]|nr:subtilisin-like protein [Suillus decipiens]
MPSISPRTVSDRVLGRFEELVTLAAHSTSLYLRVGRKARAHRILSSIKHLSLQIPRKRTKRDGSFLERAPPITPGDPRPKTSEIITERLGFVDPLFTRQCHIVNDEHPEYMMNVTGVWEMGFTGEGSLVDDGLDYWSRNLADNFDADSSYDFNDHIDLPTPLLSNDDHGTGCTCQVAVVKNDVRGIGLAYKSKVPGVRISSGPMSDADEATALNYGFHNVPIIICSWEPPDDGRSMEAPGYIIEKYFVNGIQNGRQGKGSIFVFASGNGAANGDHCNFDGYTNSIYSVTVSAIDFKGLHPYYSEPALPIRLWHTVQGAEDILNMHNFEELEHVTVRHWGENAGTWTLRVSDQSSEGHNGTFHGWHFMFWGSTIDPTLSITYVLPVSEYQLPSTANDAVHTPTSTSGKFYPKPTSGLPDDHGTAEGEANKPAFPSPSVPATATMTPTPDEGWFSDLSNLVSNQKWFFGAISAVVLFGVGAGVFFWRRRVKHRAYAALNAGDELHMSSVSRQGRPRAKELYDAFGEVSDDEDADEETRLHHSGTGFHSGFLDDNDPSSFWPCSCIQRQASRCES